MDYLFVYGTLLQAIDNPMSQFLSKHSQILGKGYFHGKLYDVGAFPAAILSALKTNKVYGTVVEILNPIHTFKVLDNYEGVHEGLYLRKMTPAFLNNQTKIEVWVYIYNNPTENLRLIPSGNYLTHFMQ